MSPRILFAAHACYLDDSNGAAVASRAMMQTVASWGWPVEVLTGSMLDRRDEVDLEAWLGGKGLVFESRGGGLTLDASGVRADVPPHLRLSVRSVPVTVHQGPTTRPHQPDREEAEEFLRLFETTLERFRPDVLVGYGGHALARSMFARARARGVRTVFALHNLHYRSRQAFADVDSVIVPSRFSARHYQSTLGLECVVLPNLIDFERVRVETRDPRFLTFVNPSPEKGVFAFARIADELGRRRPEIPILVVEGRGSEATLAGCGLELREHGNVFLMAHTHDPRLFWKRTRLCLMPSVWHESQGLVAVEAMLNGIPVIASDRGALPETLGRLGVLLPLPEWLMPSSWRVPSAREMAPWVESILRLWDGDEHRSALETLARNESLRWSADQQGPRYEAFFQELSARSEQRVLAARSLQTRRY